jgi:hypothetical protein
VLEDHDRPRARQRLAPAFQHFELGALDVDLDDPRHPVSDLLVES